MRSAYKVLYPQSDTHSACAQCRLPHHMLPWETSGGGDARSAVAPFAGSSRSIFILRAHWLLTQLFSVGPSAQARSTLQSPCAAL
jgi:hypothetical protein